MEGREWLETITLTGWLDSVGGRGTGFQRRSHQTQHVTELLTFKAVGETVWGEQEFINRVHVESSKKNTSVTASSGRKNWWARNYVTTWGYSISIRGASTEICQNIGLAGPYTGYHVMGPKPAI